MVYCIFFPFWNQKSFFSNSNLHKVSHTHTGGSASLSVSFSINSVAHWSASLSGSDLSYLPGAEILGTALSNRVWTFLVICDGGTISLFPFSQSNQQLPGAHLASLGGSQALLPGEAISTSMLAHGYKGLYLPLVQDILLSRFRVASWKEALKEVKWEKPALESKRKGYGFSENM